MVNLPPHDESSHFYPVNEMFFNEFVLHNAQNGVVLILSYSLLFYYLPRMGMTELAVKEADSNNR